MALHPLLDDFKIYKGIENDVTQDTKLSMLLYTITDSLKISFGIQTIKEVGITEKFSVKNNKIVVNIIPININSLTINDKIWDLENIIVEGNVIKDIKNPITNGNYNAEINYDAGFDTMPYDLELAIFILAARLYENSDNSGESMEYLSDPRLGRMKMLKQIPPEFYMLIAPYRSLIV